MKLKIRILNEKLEKAPIDLKKTTMKRRKKWSCKDAGLYGEGEVIDIRIAMAELLKDIAPDLSQRLFGSMGKYRVEEEQEGLSVLNANTEDDAEWIFDFDSSRKLIPKIWRSGQMSNFSPTNLLVLRCIGQV